MRATGLRVVIFLKLERYPTINRVMAPKGRVTGPILDQIRVWLLEAARHTDNTKRLFHFLRH